MSGEARVLELALRLAEAGDFTAVAAEVLAVVREPAGTVGAALAWHTDEPELATVGDGPLTCLVAAGPEPGVVRVLTPADAVPLREAGLGAAVHLTVATGPHGSATLVGLLKDGADVGAAIAAVELAAASAAPVLQRLAVAELHRAEQANSAFLAEASVVMEQSLDLPDTLQRVARLTAPTLADGCLIYLDEAPGDVELVASAHVDARVDRRIRAELPGDAALREAVRSARGAEDVRAALPGWLRPDSVRLVPLLARDRHVGTMVLTERASGRPSRLPGPQFLADLARRAAIAIDNALLYERRDAAVLALQRRLLPPSLPVLARMDLAARYEAGDPSLDVGGDFYDAVPLPGGAVALVIGDVCGRGAEAAGRTALARHTLRALLESGAGAPRALQRLNRALLDEDEDGAFCTALVVEARLCDGRAELRIVNAGHPPPVLVRASGEVEELGVHGPLLGVIPDAELEPVLVEAGDADAVLLYTDGLVEARRDRELFGAERVRDALAGAGAADAAELVARVHAAVDAFRSGGSDDDLALLALRLRGGELCRVALPGAKQAAAEARRAVRSALEATRVPERAADDVTLTVSELVAAAVLAGRPAMELVLTRAGRTVRAELRADGPDPAQAPAGGDTADPAWLVAKIAQRYSVSQGGRDGVVFAWAEVDVSDE
ncbi:PP2C family protein-serine/threonine phosphatase [Dactylosporangium sp. CS-033363]|uniref:PP2C family protein-serine/threonine phosphatase n=1 Tax=Dactylosporangium sp. CS-033363 TaxID=3239935 RepID=UPI003D915674